MLHTTTDAIDKCSRVCRMLPFSTLRYTQTSVAEQRYTDVGYGPTILTRASWALSYRGIEGLLRRLDAKMCKSFYFVERVRVVDACCVWYTDKTKETLFDSNDGRSRFVVVIP
jgi:hypothetical protein